MIEINLIEKKKPFKLPVVAGVDLNEINYKIFVVVYIINIVVENTLIPTFQEKINLIENERNVISAKKRKMEAKLKKNQSNSEMLQEFDKTVEKLKDREKQVQEVINQKSNPKNILSSITKIIPDDAWINELAVDGQKKITMRGETIKYKSISEFFRKLNELAYFNGTVVIKNSETKMKNYAGKDFRLNEFNIEANITTYGVLD